MGSEVDHNPPARAERAARALALATIVGALAVIWMPAWPSAQDAPQHLFTAHVLSHPDTFSAYFTPGAMRTGFGFTAPTVALAHVVPVRLAAKLVLTALLGSMLAGLGMLAGAARRSLGAATAAGAALFVGWAFGMGFWNYLGGLAIGMLALGVWVRARGVPGVVGAAVLLLAATCGHVVSGVLCGVMGGWLMLWIHGPVRMWRRLVPVVPAVTYVAWLVSWQARMAEAEGGPGLATRTEVAVAGHKATALWAMTYHGYSVVGIGLAAVVLATVLGALVSTLRRMRDATAPATSATRLAAGLLAASVPWLVGVALVPSWLGGWAYAWPRLLPMAFVVPVAGLDARPGRVPAGLGVTLLAAATVWTALPTAVREGARIDDAVAEMASEDVGHAFFVIVEPRPERGIGPNIKPDVQTGLYGLFGGGTNPLAFASNVYHMIRFVDPDDATRRGLRYIATLCPEAVDCSAYQAEMRDRVAIEGLSWDSVILVGRDDEARAWLDERGYREVTPRTWRPAPSGLRVTFALPDEAATRPLVIRAGYPETVGWFVGAVRPPGPGSGEQFAEFGPVPGGPIRVEAFVDRNGDGERGPDEPFVGPQGVTVDVPGGGWGEVRLAP